MGRLFPQGWDDVMVRTMMALAAAFLALALKEYVETRQLDLPGVLMDGAWVAGGALVINALLRTLSPGKVA